jgi:tRNA-uridine 2-sulfurtransferase
VSLPDLDLPGNPADHRIIVAMSGGVDSSVTAAVLVEQGFEVVGVTLQLYNGHASGARKGTCCAGRDIYDAAAVARQLGIAHYVLDYESRFRAAVIDDFVESYGRGETPVPCIRCNQRVKFRDLLGAARDLGGSALATGHYARRVVGSAGPELHRARETARDQSYFLFATTPVELDLLRFPLGGLTKEEARAQARRFDLAVADKPDSQDICFVPTGSYTQLIERLRPEACAPGDIVDRSGRLLGRHSGIANFTIGQRKGLGVAAGEPLYVLRIDPAERRVIVGPRAALAETRLLLGEMNWLGVAAVDGMTVAAKLRSTQPPVPATLYPAAGFGEAELVLDAPAGAVAPGQAAVLYDGERVLGGGWIRRRPVTGGLTGLRSSPISQRPSDESLWRDSSAG